MRMHALVAAGLATSLVAGASADLVIDLDNFTASGFDFFQQFEEGALSGTLTDVTIDAVLVQAGQNFTWASDLSVLIGTDAIEAPPYFAQIGGFSIVAGVLEYTDGLNGFSAAAGTIVNYTYALANPLEMSGKSVWLGNGYASGGAGVWSGTVTLHGVSLVPAPGALAILCCAGLVGRRRRGQ